LNTYTAVLPKIQQGFRVKGDFQSRNGTYQVDILCYNNNIFDVNQVEGTEAEVETSLLSTKLNIPPVRPQIVPRPRLMERLQEGLNYSLILVSAPAGFGKTTLVSEWARQSQIPTAWVSLDEGDNDPVRFWDYFIATLKTIRPDTGESILPALHSSQPFPSQIPVESILTALINEIAEIPGDFFMALDDYHLVESQQVHDGVNYLLGHMPANMHLIIATRADPPLPLARFRGKGTMLEIGADDLRFTEEDAVSLLIEMRIPGLSNTDIAALNSRAEGWAAGLKMAALSMSDREDIQSFIADFTGSQRYVMDYLMEEVLQKQTEEIRDFLLKTSILERLCGPLCDTVTENKGSQDILLEVERSHLFLVPLDESRQWYRYEHLFSDILRHQLEATHSTGDIIELHRRAGRWYEDNNLYDDAIHHALAAKDWDTAMRLVYSRCEELRIMGEFGTLLGWLQTIPEEILRTHYRLYSQYASYLTTINRFDAAEKALNYLESVAHDDVAIQAEAAFSLANLARHRGDSSRCVDMAKRALSLLPPESITMRSRANFIIGYVQYESGQFHEAQKWLSDAYDSGMQAGEYTVASHSVLFLGGIALWNGKLNDAKETIRKSIEVGGVGAASRTMMCRVLYELNELEAVAEYARIAIELSKRAVIVEAKLGAYMFQAKTGLAKSDMVTVGEAIEKLDEISNNPSITKFNIAKYLAFRVLHAIRLGNIEEAIKWNNRLSEYIEILHPECIYIPARLLIAQGKKEEATTILQGCYRKLVQMNAYGLVIGVRVCQALAANTEEAALEFLTDALVRGEPEGFIRTFVDEGELLKPLLEKALLNRVKPEYTRKLITIIEAKERVKLKKQKTEGVRNLHQTILSEREMEVLKLLAEGLSNQQIAARLVITTGTAKNHIHSILEKLNAEGRTQAIARARELEII
jgi:LuxR family maltose regulon positive regulatory protein